MAIRHFHCPDHGDVEEDTRARDERGFASGYHCCASVGHRCGWDGDKDDKGGCHRRLLAKSGTAAPTAETTAAERRRIAADPTAVILAAREQASKKRIVVSDGGSVERQEQLEIASTAATSVPAEDEAITEPGSPLEVTRRADGDIAIGVRSDIVEPFALTAFLNDLDEALEHVTSGESATCQECRLGGGCQVGYTLTRLADLRDAGMFPPNTRKRRLLAVLATPEHTESEITRVLLEGMKHQYPEGEVTTREDGNIEVWTRAVGVPLPQNSGEPE